MLYPRRQPVDDYQNRIIQFWDRAIKRKKGNKTEYQICFSFQLFIKLNLLLGQSQCIISFHYYEDYELDNRTG